MTSSLLRRLRLALRRNADSSKAPQMQAYTKSLMPYLGVPLPRLRRICKEVFADLALETAQEWQDEVLQLWRNARFREERYGALILAGHRRAREFQVPSAMKMYEEMIITGAWWDYVDDLAIHHVGPILASHPVSMKKKMLLWSKSRNLWKRRTSILCQIMVKDRLDLKLLYSCIEPSMESKEFFLRKAIGWALRSLAWKDPEEVVRYVRRNRARLSALSKREALRNVGGLETLP
jgi:3-methyladenine DNA glycosylase AlkD